MERLILMRIVLGISAAGLWATLPAAAAPTVTPSTFASHHHRAGLAGSFLVPDLPLCAPRVRLDGQADVNDWLHTDCASHLLNTFGSGSLTVTSRMFVFHTHWPLAPASPDTLYLYISMTDNTADGASDYVVLMLDTQHTPLDPSDDAGLCFRRDAKILRVNSATSTCSGAATTTASANRFLRLRTT